MAKRGMGLRVGKSLLVLDDEPEFGSFVRKVGENVGFEVSVISDAREFRDAYEKVEPHKIVLDILMPGMDGIEVIRWLASIDNKASVVIVSGYAPRYGKAAEALADAQGHFLVTTLSKPVSVAELSSALEL